MGAIKRLEKIGNPQSTIHSSEYPCGQDIEERHSPEFEAGNRKKKCANLEQNTGMTKGSTVALIV